MKVYEATKNSDRTEGRGYPVTIGVYTDIEDAVAAVKGMGVMGVGDGDVYELEVQDNFNPSKNYGPEKTLVYGYRQDLRGKWGYGYVDNRDQAALAADPEFQEFLRLQAKYEK